MAITAQEAVAAATSFLRDLYAGILPDGVGLEEIERTDNGLYWNVTLGWPRNPDPLHLLVPSKPKPDEMEYKAFKVEGSSGQVIAMKIRKP